MGEDGTHVMSIHPSRMSSVVAHSSPSRVSQFSFFPESGHVAGTFPPTDGGLAMSSANGARAGICSTIWRCWLGTTEPAAGGGDFVRTPSQEFWNFVRTHPLSLLPSARCIEKKNQEAEQTQTPPRCKIPFTLQRNMNLVSRRAGHSVEPKHSMTLFIPWDGMNHQRDTTKGLLGMCSQKLGTRRRGGMTRDEGDGWGHARRVVCRAQFSSFAACAC